MASWEPRSTLAKAVVAAGFRYDPTQDIIYSKMDAWQRHLGYTWAYDVASAPLHMIIDCEPFYFHYEGKLWMIELWKGQYGLETGCEIGVYRDDFGHALAPFNPRSRFFACVGDAHRLKMKFTLSRNGKTLLHRGPEFHWWLTGFKWGVFTGHTHDLTMDVEIVFPSTEMRDAFKRAAKQNRYYTTEKDPFSIALTFQRPHTPQPGSRAALEGRMQTNNQVLVGGYDLLKKALKLSNNDPNAFTELDPAAQEAVHLASGATATIRHAASAAARKLGKATAAARTLRSEAAAAAKRLESEVSDDAMTAYYEIFGFFDKKVWHATYQPGRAVANPG